MEAEKLEFVKNIEGWQTDNEARLLYSLAKNCSGKGVIVEIGSWKGKSTICLAFGSKAGKKVKVYAVDPHKDSYEHKGRNIACTLFDFKKNIKKAGVNDLVVPIVKTSEEAAKNFNKPVELVFIDGDHSYEAAKLDFELWFPKVVNGGIIAFHDTLHSEGVKKVVSEFVFKSKNFKNTGLVDSITFACKTKQNTFFDRLRNRWVFFTKKLYEFIGKLPLPKFLRKLGKKVFFILFSPHY